MKRSLLSTCETAINISYYLLFSVTPLIVCPWTEELFEFPKLIFVYALTLIIGYVYLIKITHSNRSGKKEKKNALWLPFTLYLLTVSLSTIFSIHPYTSLFGYYSRFHGSLLSLISYFILAYIFTSQFRGKDRKIKNMLKSLLTTGFLVSIYGIGQHFGIDNSYWIQDSTLRVFATLGQPNWLAAWLLLLLPFSWLFFFSTKKRGRNLLYATLTLVLFTSFWFTYSLSGLLGLGVTVSVFLILRSPKYFLAKWKKTLFLSLGYFSIILLNLGPLKERARKTIKHMTQKEAAYAAEYIPPTERGDTLKIRKLVWQGAIDLWKSTPKNIVLGTGPETFAYAFLAFRPQQLNNTSEWDFLYNRAHNEYIDILCEHGLLAFGAYTYLIIKFIHYATKKKKPNASQNLSSALVSGWVGLLVTNFFGFSVVPTALLFWLYPAICICVKN